MNRKRWMNIGLACGMAMAVGTANRSAAEEEKPLDAAMLQAQKLGSPGEEHKRFESFVGNWTFKSHFWMKPNEAPQESQGTSENALILGGRFLKREFKANWNGQPMEGIGYSGYDNVRGEYQSVWLCGMGTGIMQTAGAFDPASQAIRESGHFSCPMTGEKATWFRSEWKVLSNDRHVYISYTKDAEGKEYKFVEETYERVK